MGQQSDIRGALLGRKPKKQSKKAPSTQELARRYFDLQCLRHRVRIAESGQPVRRQVTQPVAAFAALS